MLSDVAGKGHRVQHVPVLFEDRLPLPHPRPGAGRQAELLFWSQAGQRRLHGAGMKVWISLITSCRFG